MSPNTVGVPVELILAVHGSEGPREERKNAGSLITYMGGGCLLLFFVFHWFLFVCLSEIGRTLLNNSGWLGTYHRPGWPLI